MSRLKEYRTKRSLTKSTEPKAQIASKNKNSNLIFVVQKHDARQLHYDLRLELNGVLKSWAVPKGPSMNPSEKRLAMMVEDHPYDYRTFEGIIPKGNYGAGTVMVWDEGIYRIPEGKSQKESERLALEGIEKGHLDFILEGKKLKGEFSLIRMKLNDSSNSWLLMKKKDAFATTKDISKLDHSAKTNRTLKEISNAESNDNKKTNAEEIPKVKLPLKISPMLGVLIKEPFDKDGWLFENKWDGFRAIAQIQSSNILLYSRNHISFNERFPIIVDELEKFSVTSAILDGEIVLLDSKGNSKFQQMQNYKNVKDGNIFYYVFDILYLNGYDLRRLPLIERKNMLKLLLSKNPSANIGYTDHVEKNGKIAFQKAAKKHLEGIMGKEMQSSYQMKRSSDWVKIKTHLRQEAIIIGFTEPKGQRKKIGALVLGVYAGKILKYVGRVGTGFTEKSLSEIYHLLEPLIQAKCPITNFSKSEKTITWVKPKLTCEISYTEETDEGLMRHPVFKGLRIDKKATDVKVEHPVDIKKL